MKSQYPIGLVDPYSILVVTGAPNNIYTPDYFAFETGLINQLLSTSAAYLSTQSLTGVSYCNGYNVSYGLAVQYRNKSSPLYNTKKASSYRGLTNGLVNTDQSVTIIQVNTIIDPDSQAISQFIVNTRNLLKSYSAANPLPTGTTSMYLFGGFTTTYDLQQIVYGLVPVMVAVTFIAVMLLIGLGFGSVFLTLRLLLTVGMSLSWAYGLMVSRIGHAITNRYAILFFHRLMNENILITVLLSLNIFLFNKYQVVVYQPGSGQAAFSVLSPSLTRSTGIYWIIPIMSFSILVGLALDYDIFLMTRMVEFRRLGWSDRASICLAIQKTGYIISTAGLIMSISFAGLLIPPTIVLNQYGFALFLGVAIDTFIVRTVLMPAVVAASGSHTNVFWWPSRMPTVILSAQEEENALWKGYWNPHRFVEDSKAVIVISKDIEIGDLVKKAQLDNKMLSQRTEFTEVMSFNRVESTASSIPNEEEGVTTNE